MLIDQAVKTVYSLREKNNDYPDPTSEDYLAILQAINSAVNIWESHLNQGTLWRELFATAPLTISGGVANAPSDFLVPSSLVINKTAYRYVRPDEGVDIKNDDQTAKVYWITGGRGARKINCTTDGDATLNYYKTATTYTTGAELTPLEMADPYFAIYFALGQLYLDDDNPQAQFTNDTANEKLTQMKIANEADPFSYDKAVGFGI